MMKVQTLLCLILAASITSANAAVISSECAVKPTEATNDADTVDRYRPSDARLALRSYSQEFAGALKYVSWIWDSRFSDDEKKQWLRDYGSMTEDVEMTMILADPKSACHGAKEVYSDRYAIFPYILRNKEPAGNYTYRVRYKYCEYYVDHSRQLPIDNMCTVIGRESGYTFNEIADRYAMLKRHLGFARSTIAVGTGIGGVALSLTVLRVLSFFRIGATLGLAVATIPTGAAFYAIYNGWTDEVVRDLANFQDAAEIAITGDLATSVKVAHPIQEFLPYFVRYLGTMDLQDLKTSRMTSPIQVR